MAAIIPNSGSECSWLPTARTQTPGSSKMIPAVTISAVRQPCRGGGMASASAAGGSPGVLGGRLSVSLIGPLRLASLAPLFAQRRADQHDAAKSHQQANQDEGH